MVWVRMLAYITGTLDQELLLRNEYLAAENRILKAQIKGRLLLSEADKATLAEIVHRLGRKALEEVAAAAKPDTILGWYGKLIANKFDGSRFRGSAGRPRVDEETERMCCNFSGLLAGGVKESRNGNPTRDLQMRQTEPGLILCAVRWYLRYSLSLRDVEELLEERGLDVDHTTVWRWVQYYSPELEQRLRRHLKPTNKSWRVDETYVRVKGRWCYLYRAIDSRGATIDFLLSAFRDADAAKRLFRKALSDRSHPQPRVINTDLAPIYSSAIPDSKKEGTLRNRCRHRPVQYLNNILEQDHRAIKRRVNAKQGFREFQAARRTIQGYEAVHMIRKGQARWVAGDDLLRQIQFIDSLFDLAAQERTTDARRQTCLHLKLATLPTLELDGPAGLSPVCIWLKPDRKDAGFHFEWSGHMGTAATPGIKPRDCNA